MLVKIVMMVVVMVNKLVVMLVTEDSEYYVEWVIGVVVVLMKMVGNDTEMLKVLVV